MGDVLTSRSASCCSFGALEDFGVACAGSDWSAAYSPQKIPEIRFLDGLAQAARIGSQVARTSIEQGDLLVA
jgi:hypothetical protein